MTNAFVRKLPHAIVSPLILHRHQKEIREQERTRVALGLPSIAELDLSGIRRSDTLFVLGSGSSINDMSDERFAVIARHDSLGFNYWLAHPFVPSLYLFYPGVARSEEERAAVNQLMYALMAERADEYRDRVKIVTDLFAHHAPTLQGCPPSFMTHAYAAEREILFARNPEELATALRDLDRRGVFDTHTPDRPITRLFKYCASLAATLALAIHMGHRRVVLCGIDLNTSSYFYEDERRYPRMAGFHGSSTPGAAQHPTLLRWSSLMMPIDEVVYAMREVLYRPRGIELFVESATSALHPRVPLLDDAAWARL